MPTSRLGNGYMFFLQKKEINLLFLTLKRLKLSIQNIFFIKLGFTLSLMLFLFTGKMSAQGNTNGLEKIDNSSFFQTNKYSYFKEKLSFHLNIQQQESFTRISGVLLKIESDDKKERTFIIDWEEGATYVNIFILFDNKVKKYRVPIDKDFLVDPTSISLDINFITDKSVLTIANESINIYNLHFSIQNGYKFDLLPELASPKNPNIISLLTILDLNIHASIGEAHNTSWIWFFIIILIDLVIFLIIHYHNKYRKKRAKEKAEMLMQQADPIIKIQMPVKSAIYMFGRFHVYDNNGKDITKSFSPMLKELLCLLIVYSKRKGISSDKLKEFLWADKTDASARNNRAVYIGKLRTILNGLGTCRITNKTGYWRLETSDIFIDYYQYKDLLSKEALNKKSIEKIIAIVNNGNLMPAYDYLWMDVFKDETSNETIQTLLNFSGNLKLGNEPRLILKLADIIFRFDYLNEQALYLRCKAYNVLGQHASSKNSYDKFCEEYKTVYGENFNIGFKDIEKLSSWT